MANYSSNLGVPPTATATTSSSGRSKIALQPGRSLMDWIRLTHSGKNLAGTKGKCIDVSPRELAKHNTREDAWIALRGQVYNITHYLEYHPGGVEELMRGAGTDATDLFNEVHSWVNAESMLQKCFVGFLKKSWTLNVPKFPPLTQLKIKHKKTFTTPDHVNKSAVIAPSSNCKDSEIMPGSNPDKLQKTSENSCLLDEPKAGELNIFNGKVEWPVSLPLEVDSSETSIRFKKDGNFLKLVINGSNAKHGLITDLINQTFFIKTRDSSYIYNIVLPVTIMEDYEVDMQEAHTIEIVLKMLDREIEVQHPALAVKNINLICEDITWTLRQPTAELFWPCTLTNKTPINYNTFLFTFQFPPGMKMWVPIGCHVFIKSCIEGIEVVRSYTPVILSFDVKTESLNDGHQVTFMIKIYESGAMTSILNQCNIGENLWISNYTGNFSDVFLSSCDSVILLAAGTGITPMIKIIKWVMTSGDKRRSMLLLFFNKTEEDIIWRNEFQTCQSVYEAFQVIHILSEPSEQWGGYSGKLDNDLVHRLVPAKFPDIKQRIFICGPLPFTDFALRCLEGVGYSEDDMYAFKGA